MCRKNRIESVKLQIVELILSFFLLIHRSIFAIMNLKECGLSNESIELVSWCFSYEKMLGAVRK